MHNLGKRCVLSGSWYTEAPVMSLRPREAYENAQQFSLRDALGGAPPSAAPVPAPASTGLSFDLGAVQKMQQAQNARPVQKCPSAPAVVRPPPGLSLRFGNGGGIQLGASFQKLQPASPQTCAQVPGFQARGIPAATTPPLTFASPRPASSLSSSQAATRDAAVMRLTAQVDELNGKLKQAQNRLVQTEAQLTRTSHVLCNERQSSEKAIQSFKRDLVGARDAETKLRTELANAKKTTLKNSTFLASVDSALASDEQIQSQQRSMQELETKVTALADFKVKLEAEVNTLQSERAEVQKVLDAMRVEHEEHSLKAKAATLEMTEAQAALEGMKKEHSALVEKLAEARVTEATVSEAVGALHVTREIMDAENAKVGAATQAMLLEHGDASRTLAEVRGRVQEMEAREASLAKALEAASKPAVSAPEARSGRRRGSVTGAAAPQHALCSGLPTENGASQEAHRVPDSPDRVSAPLAIDAPIDIALKRVAFVGANHLIISAPTGGGPKPTPDRNEERTAAMVGAVVGDLKARLTEISMQEPVWRTVAPLA